MADWDSPVRVPPAPGTGTRRAHAPIAEAAARFWPRWVQRADAPLRSER